MRKLPSTISLVVRLLSLPITAVFVAFEPAFAEEYRAIFWNLESGEADMSLLASQMVDKGTIDFFGLSEVPDQGNNLSRDNLCV